MELKTGEIQDGFLSGSLTLNRTGANAVSVTGNFKARVN